jgi:hypothetical protein
MQPLLRFAPRMSHSFQKLHLSFWMDRNKMYLVLTSLYSYTLFIVIKNCSFCLSKSLRILPLHIVYKVQMTTLIHCIKPLISIADQ